MGVKNFKCLLISLPKCIELNSELILILVLDLILGSHPGPRPNIYFFLDEMSGSTSNFHFFIDYFMTLNNVIFLTN